MSFKALLATVDALKLRKLIKLVVALLQADRFWPTAAACRSRLHDGLQCVGTARGMATKDLDVSVLQIILRAISDSSFVCSAGAL